MLQFSIVQKELFGYKNTNIKTKIFKKDNKFRIRAFHTARYQKI